MPISSTGGPPLWTAPAAPHHAVTAPAAAPQPPSTREASDPDLTTSDRAVLTASAGAGPTAASGPTTQTLGLDDRFALAQIANRVADDRAAGAIVGLLTPDYLGRLFAQYGYQQADGPATPQGQDEREQPRVDAIA